MSPVASGGPPHSRSTSVNVGGPVGMDSSARIGGSGPMKGGNRVFPHIDDLINVRPDVDLHKPIRKILQDAELLSKQADTHLDFHRQDMALQEYLQASAIAAEILPRHKDYPETKIAGSDLHRLNIGLLKRVSGQNAKFDAVMAMIVEDNKRTGVRPTLEEKGDIGPERIMKKGEYGHARAHSVQTSALNGTPSSNSNGIQDHDHHNSSGQWSAPYESSNGVQGRPKPPVHPKPNALHGKALPTSSDASQIDLAARFAKLRRTQPPNAIQDSRIRTQPITILNSSQTLLESTSVPTSGKTHTTIRPVGPREFPSVPTSIPQSPKAVLDLHIPDMPKPPDPIYSPASITDSTANNNLPSSITRSSSYLNGGRSNAAPPISKVGRTPSIPSTPDFGQDYFVAAHKSESTSSQNPRERLIPDIPNVTYVSAEKLFDFIGHGSQTLRLLLVDLRSREEFDAGHIMAPSIICIEPISLRVGMSAEQLGESIVLSPDAEQELYEKRNEFDIVVFYDQSSTKLLSSTTTHNKDYLENFSKALFDYGYAKELKRRPMLLIGGLDAWVDLMGPRSLTSSISGTSSLKPARPFGRVTISRDLRRKIPRSGVRLSQPFSKEEEKKWDETIRDASEAIASTAEDPDSEDFSYARSTDDFLRKYPELPSIQESMVSTPPVPFSPSRFEINFNTSVPSPPARPAPALPRQRSSGLSERGPTATYAMTPSNSITASNPAAGLTGLTNASGKTCYANSVVQSLSASPVIRQLLSDYHYQSANTPVPPKKSSEPDPPPQFFMRNLQLIVKALWAGRFADVKPTHFLKYVQDLSKKALPYGTDPSQCFGNNQTQHDAQEFLAFIFEVMLDEINEKRDRPEWVPIPDSEKLPLTTACTREWESLQQCNQSRLWDAFGGLAVQTLECKNCKRISSSTFSPFQSNREIYFPGSSAARTSFRSLLDYAENFGLDTAPPEWKCENCKSGNGEKRIKIAYLPKYINFYFVRTQARGGKIRTNIDLDLDNIDLAPAHISSHPDARPGPNSDSWLQVPKMYEAYALIMHHGTTTNAGHYVALTRNLEAVDGMRGRQWHAFNDSRVYPYSLRDLEKESFQLALMFLRRKASPRSAL